MARRILRILTAVTVVTLVTAFVAATVLFTNGSLRVPRRIPVPLKETLPEGAAIRDVHIAAQGGVRLEGWFLTPDAGYRRCVAVLHGIADSRSGSIGFARMFLDAGYAVLVPDSRGHGASGGEIVTYGLLESDDALHWARWLRDQGCADLYGLGESLGAAVLIRAAGVEPQFRAIAAECSYRDLRSIAEYRVLESAGLPTPVGAPLAKLLVGSSLIYAQLRYGLDLSEASPIKSIAKASTPILLIHGLDDRETPPSHSIELSSASAKTELWLAPGAGAHCRSLSISR